VWPGRPTGFGRALSGESQGLFDERSPRVGQGWGDGGPLAEPAACGGEWLAVARLEQFGDAGLAELDEQMSGAAVARCEELAVETKAGQPHHGGGRDAGLSKQRLREAPETLLAAGA
jgi:hypothetical protein